MTVKADERYAFEDDGEGLGYDYEEDDDGFYVDDVCDELLDRIAAMRRRQELTYNERLLLDIIEEIVELL